MTDLSVLVLPDRHPVSAFVADVVEAERAGVRTVWTYDHITWPLLADQPWYGAVPILAAAATATSRVRLGLQVASPNYREPAPFAKELMTLDQISGGRLEAGLGAGTEGPDAIVLGNPQRTPRERMDRFVEWIGLLDTLLTQDVTTVRGERFSAVGASMMPGCVQKPRVPFTVAGTGPRSLAQVARYGQAWVTYGPYGPQVGPDQWFAALALQAEKLDKALGDRPASEVRRVVQFGVESQWAFESRDRYADTVGRLAELGFDEISLHWPRPDGRGIPSAFLPVVLESHGL
jgi:alkanesulfonate monooxygenase SsuD/methylene tetrahydromethanopterin reductase-like flavin-dependent oxidoreductase (luciferase family)